MSLLVTKIGRAHDAVVAAYAKAERDGIVERKRNASGLNPEEYARALWRDGERRGWF